MTIIAVVDLQESTIKFVQDGETLDPRAVLNALASGAAVVNHWGERHENGAVTNETWSLEIDNRGHYAERPFDT